MPDMSRQHTAERSITMTGTPLRRSSSRSAERRLGDESTVTRPATATVISPASMRFPQDLFSLSRWGTLLFCFRSYAIRQVGFHLSAPMD